MLVRKKDDARGTLYAMKTLRKQALLKRNQVAHTTTERYILQNIHCPFLVHLMFAFQTSDKLYMVIDYMAGGELFFWLKKDKKFSETRSRLYCAEITVALETLHSADIVYRDLKPENIL
jgi:serum/glucocorticoid-regulated kinase 2